jgi:hypothetical protein
MKSSYLLFLHWNEISVTKPWVVQEADVALDSEPGKVLVVMLRVLQPRETRLFRNRMDNSQRSDKLRFARKKRSYPTLDPKNR